MGLSAFHLIAGWAALNCPIVHLTLPNQRVTFKEVSDGRAATKSAHSENTDDLENAFEHWNNLYK
jgi:hypothetical protein